MFQSTSTSSATPRAPATQVLAPLTWHYYFPPDSHRIHHLLRPTLNHRLPLLQNSKNGVNFYSISHCTFICLIPSLLICYPKQFSAHVYSSLNFYSCSHCTSFCPMSWSLLICFPKPAHIYSSLDFYSCSHHIPFCSHCTSLWVTSCSMPICSSKPSCPCLPFTQLLLQISLYLCTFSQVLCSSSPPTPFVLSQPIYISILPSPAALNELSIPTLLFPQAPPSPLSSVHIPGVTHSPIAAREPTSLLSLKEAVRLEGILRVHVPFSLADLSLTKQKLGSFTSNPMSYIKEFYYLATSYNLSFYDVFMTLYNTFLPKE